jgi:competence protein ComEA
VEDAIAAAGGADADAELTGLNQAGRVRDEEHYHVPRLGETPPIATVTTKITSNSSATSSGLIDLNVASVDLLDTWPGIGPSLANAILSYREQNGPFGSVEAIMDVPGIGPATYEKIRDLVTVG